MVVQFRDDRPHWIGSIDVMKLDYFASQNAPDFVRVEFDGNENYVRYQSITRIIKDAARRAKLRGV